MYRSNYVCTAVASSANQVTKPFRVYLRSSTRIPIGRHANRRKYLRGYFLDSNSHSHIVAVACHHDMQQSSCGRVSLHYVKVQPKNQGVGVNIMHFFQWCCRQSISRHVCAISESYLDPRQEPLPELPSPDV